MYLVEEFFIFMVSLLYNDIFRLLFFSLPINNQNYSSSFPTSPFDLSSYPGLGVEKNKTLGCELISQANTLLPMNPTMTYYQGLCFLQKRRFDEANNRFFSACMSQFAPAIDSVIRMKELRLGQKIKMDLSSYLGATMASRLREKYALVVDVG